jgi:hypothetical protein
MTAQEVASKAAAINELLSTLRESGLPANFVELAPDGSIRAGCLPAQEVQVIQSSPQDELFEMWKDQL